MYLTSRTLFILLIAIFIGCGGDAEPPTPAVLQEITPPRSIMPVNTSIVLKFDKKPVNFATDWANGYRYGSDIAENARIPYAMARTDRFVLIRGPLRIPVTEIKIFWGATEPQETGTLGYIVTPLD